MPSSLIRRLSAWLCLMLSLLIGSAPAQGFVLCLEPDGCVSLEIATASESCGACAEHAQEADAGCPCVDLPVTGPESARPVQPKPAELTDLQLAVWVATLPEVLSSLRAEVALEFRAVPRGPPRPPGSLALIRSVVLLV
jgi:hypothetical protein